MQNGWEKTLLSFLAVVSLISSASTIDNLRVAFQWKQIDYDWPSNDTKQLFPDYKQENNLPLGLEVAGDRLFITVPRWKRGVVSSLNYIMLNDSRQSPPLIPYPSWEAHQYKANKVPEVVSAFRIRADRCNRLWVLDTGMSEIADNPEQQALPTLIIYDLSNDRILRKYTIPEDQRTADSFFANIAVEDESCIESYGYLGDLGGPGIVVYSWKLDKSWLVKHSFFHPDPQNEQFNVSGLSFRWKDGVFGMALAPTGDGYSTLYFHPLTSTKEFSVSTKVLRDPEQSKFSEGSNEFRYLGSRGPNGQSSVSFLDPKTGILIYALANLNAIACWRAGPKYDIQQQGRVYMNDVTMVFPNDLKIDPNGNIWVLSDRLPQFLYSHLNLDEYNFRILTGSVKEAVQGTVCSMNPPSQSSFMPNGPRDAPQVMSSDRSFSGRSGSGRTFGTVSIIVAFSMLLKAFV